MDRDAFIIGVGAGVFLMGLIAIANVGVYQDRINALQSELSGLEAAQRAIKQTVAEQEYALELKESSLREKEAVIMGLNQTIIDQSQDITDLGELNYELNEEIDLLEVAVDLVGRDEIKNTLVAYGKLFREYEELIKQYETLSEDYQQLLNSTK